MKKITLEIEIERHLAESARNVLANITSHALTPYASDSGEAMQAMAVLWKIERAIAVELITRD